MNFKFYLDLLLVLKLFEKEIDCFIYFCKIYYLDIIDVVILNN